MHISFDAVNGYIKKHAKDKYHYSLWIKNIKKIDGIKYLVSQKSIISSACYYNDVKIKIHPAHNLPLEKTVISKQKIFSSNYKHYYPGASLVKCLYKLVSLQAY